MKTTSKVRSFLYPSFIYLFSASLDAALVKSYDFDNGLGDTLGNGFDLVSSGGTVAGGRYIFSDNQGLRLTSALPSTTNYAIEIQFQLNDSVGGYNKTIDFQDLSSDIGLYVQGGFTQFYNITPLIGPGILVNEEITLGIERSAGSVQFFFNGVAIGSGPYADGGGGVSGGNVLNFFEDDFDTGQGESFSGSAGFIRIHNDSSTFGTTPVPEPSSTALLGLGGLALMLRRRR